jgi:hypothetical protein
MRANKKAWCCLKGRDSIGSQISGHGFNVPIKRVLGSILLRQISTSRLTRTYSTGCTEVEPSHDTLRSGVRFMIVKFFGVERALTFVCFQIRLPWSAALWRLSGQLHETDASL